jgi:DNA polymerase IIIc chi subunit
MRNNPKVIFLQIKKSLEKLLKITKIANLHFESGKRLLFLVADEKAQKFMDEFLWKEPNFSFLPHSCNENSKEIIIISQKIVGNINYIFNLTASPILDLCCLGVYEFDECSDLSKMRIAKRKFKFYKEKNLNIEAR